MSRALAPLLAIMLVGCGHPAKLAADHAWVRLAAVPGGPAAAYLTIHGGARDAVLVGITAPAAHKAEMHETMAMGGAAAARGSMTMMAPLARLIVPANGRVELAPGGRHVMLFGVDPGVKPGATLPLVLAFANGTQVTAHAEAIAAGDPAPQ